MATRDYEFAPLHRLIDGSRDCLGEAPWVRVRAVKLVESMEPFHLPIGRKQRLLLSLGHGWVRRRSVWVRPVVVAALLIGSGAIASAALTDWPDRLFRSCQTLISRKVGFRPSARPEAARADVTSQARAAEPVRSTESRPAAPVRRLPLEVHSRGRLPLAPPSDDPSLLIQATHALRVDRDPKLARALANRYLEWHPRGVLADEALAISIEAAIENNDADVRALSAQYLAQFPRGSFRGLAERALAPSDRH